MINLIPPEAKKGVAREYLVRIASAWMLLFSIVALVGFVTLIPSYVLVRSQLKAMDFQISKVEASDEIFENAETLIVRANDIASQLNQPHVAVLMHEVIETVNEVTPNGVRVHTYLIERTDKSISSINVAGVADSRESLAEFKRAIEETILFETAVVPISDLAREQNLPFAIEIILKSSDVTP